MIGSIIITTYNRSELLSYGLESLSKQNLSKDDYEIIVLNDGDKDDGTEGICELFSDSLNIKYFSTGRDYKYWRIPGYAINFGLRQAAGQYVFLSCAEIYHCDNTVAQMIGKLEQDPKALTICSAKDDCGKFLKKIATNQIVTNKDYDELENLHNVRFPFFMGMSKSEIIKIGGYDEEFIGIGFDDNDIVHRLNSSGCHHVMINSCRIVHLYHPRLPTNEKELYGRLKHNERLFYSKKNVINRNTNKEWGTSF